MMKGKTMENKRTIIVLSSKDWIEEVKQHWKNNCSFQTVVRKKISEACTCDLGLPAVFSLKKV